MAVSDEAVGWLGRWLGEEMERVYADVVKDPEMAGYLRDKKSGEVKPLRGFHGKGFSQNVLYSVAKNAVCPKKEGRYILWNHKDSTLNVFNGRYYESITERPEECLRQLILEAFTRLEVSLAFRIDVPRKLAYDCVGTLMSMDRYKYIPSRRYVAFRNGVLDVWNYPQKSAFKDKFDCKYRPAVVLDFDYMDEREHHVLCSQKYTTPNGNRELHPYEKWGFTIGGWDDIDIDKKDNCKKDVRYRNAIFPKGDARRTVQMFCGGLFVDREQVAFQYICILQGNGANGKSLFTKAIANVFPDKYIGKLSMEQLFGRNNRFSAACTSGKIVNIAGDMDDRDFSGGMFKSFVEGAPMMAEKKGVDFKVMIPPIILGCTNHDPASKDKSWGHYRRMRIVKTRGLPIKEEECDTELEAKLGTDDAKLAILHWMLKGYVKLKKNGWKIPETEEMKETREILQFEDSSVMQFVQDNFLVACEWDDEDAKRMTSTEMHARYKAWCESRRIKYPENQIPFGKQMEEQGFVRRKGRGGCIEWRYLVIKNESINEE